MAVCGESDPQTALGDIAFAAGRGIAERGAVLLCGGLTGVMEHAARGARAAGGLTVGLLPGTDPDEANPYIDVAIATGLGRARNAVIALAADGIVVVGGGLGTLSEVALALSYGRPAIGIRTWRFERDAQTEPGLPILESVPEALGWLFSRLT